LTSMRRIEANRQNAQRSTGPKTAEGKARVSTNALVHGLFARQALLPYEAPHEFEELGEALRAALNPQGVHEQILVESMISALWRRRRLSRVEAGIYSSTQCRILAGRARREARTYERSELAVLSEPLDAPLITDPEKHQQAIIAAEQMTARGNEPTAMFGLTFIRAASAFATLSRCEASVERTYYRALHELQRLQHARLGGHVPPPLAVDVTVSGHDNGGVDGPGQGGESLPEQPRPAELERSIEEELFGP
jgi:hypothetical protein